MNNKINSINEIQSWEDIEKYIKTFYCESENDFIILKKENNNYTLIQEKEIKVINDITHFDCYMLPKQCLKNLDYITSSFTFSGFNSLPRYKIIYDLYRYKNNNSTYKLLWFISAVYEILENKYYIYWFNKCINYDENTIEYILEYFLDICSNEIEKRLDILSYKYIFGGSRKNFLPVDSISYNYKYINKNLDISDINVIIDYIALIIELVKSQYSFIVIYTRS